MYGPIFQGRAVQRAASFQFPIRLRRSGKASSCGPKAEAKCMGRILMREIGALREHFFIIF